MITIAMQCLGDLSNMAKIDQCSGPVYTRAESRRLLRACAIRKMHTSADFRHGTTLGPLQWHSQILYAVRAVVEIPLFIRNAYNYIYRCNDK